MGVQHAISPCTGSAAPRFPTYPQMNVIFVPCHSNPCSVMSLSHSRGLFYTFYYYVWNGGNSLWQMCNHGVGSCVCEVSSRAVTNLWEEIPLWQKRRRRILTEVKLNGRFCRCINRNQCFKLISGAQRLLLSSNVDLSNQNIQTLFIKHFSYTKQARKLIDWTYINPRPSTQDKKMKQLN